jgi:hypothetical protein
MEETIKRLVAESAEHRALLQRLFDPLLAIGGEEFDRNVWWCLSLQFTGFLTRSSSRSTNDKCRRRSESEWFRQYSKS